MLMMLSLRHWAAGLWTQGEIIFLFQCVSVAYISIVMRLLDVLTNFSCVTDVLLDTGWTVTLPISVRVCLDMFGRGTALHYADRGVWGWEVPYYVLLSGRVWHTRCYCWSVCSYWSHRLWQTRSVRIHVHGLCKYCLSLRVECFVVLLFVTRAH